MVAMTGGIADRMNVGPRGWRGWLMPAGWRLWLWWVLANAVGWSVGGYLGAVDGRWSGWALSGGIATVGYGAGAAAGGIGAGVLQWLVLRRQVARAGWWVLASSAAGAVVGVLLLALGATVGFGVRWIDGGPETTGTHSLGDSVMFVVLGLYGSILGALQWLVLRRQVDRAGWWVLASTVAWPVSIGVGGIGLGVVVAVTGAKLPAVAAALIPALYGAITGRVLVWLLRERLPTAATGE